MANGDPRTLNHSLVIVCVTAIMLATLLTAVVFVPITELMLIAIAAFFLLVARCLFQKHEELEAQPGVIMLGVQL